MVGVQGGGSELAQLCVINFNTRKVLINTLVEPYRSVVDWRTRFSGINSTDMALAKTSHLTLRGWAEARSELFKHIDHATVLVGHALQHDLKALYGA